jgi:hypothetical protein
MGNIRNAHKLLVKKPEMWRLTRRENNNIKTDFKEMGCEVVD